MALEVELIEVLDAPTTAPTPEQPIAVLRSAALADFNAVNAGIAALTALYAGKTYEVATTSGMDEAKAARVAIRNPRYKVEHIRKAQKATLTQLGKDVEAEAERITAELLALETPIDKAIKAEEDRKAAEKAKREQEERDKQKLIDDAIAEIGGKVVEVAGKSSAEIEAALEWLEGTEITLEDFGDSAGRALQTHHATKAKLLEMLATAHAQEVAQREIEAQRAELQRKAEQQEADAKALREQLEAQQAELTAMRAAAQAEADAKTAKEAKAQAEAARLQRAADERARAVQTRLDAITSVHHFHVDQKSDSETISDCINTLTQMDINEAFFEGRVAEAEQALDAALAELQSLLEEVEGEETLQQERDLAESNRRAALTAQILVDTATRERAHEMLDLLRAVAADVEFVQLAPHTKSRIAVLLAKIPTVAA